MSSTARRAFRSREWLRDLRLRAIYSHRTASWRWQYVAPEPALMKSGSRNR
jgi:hypothetical protein